MIVKTHKVARVITCALRHGGHVGFGHVGRLGDWPEAQLAMMMSSAGKIYGRARVKMDGLVFDVGKKLGRWHGEDEVDDGAT